MRDVFSVGEGLIAAHGGVLVNGMAGAARAAELQAASRDWPSWDLTPRQLCDLELLLNGGFSPLRGFMTRADYDGVCESMRLAGGTLWPMPITLDVPEAFAQSVAPGSVVALRDAEGVMLAALHVEDVWTPDRTRRGAAGVRHDRCAAPWRRRARAEPPVLHRRPARGRAGAIALRLRRAAADTGAGPRRVPEPRLVARGRVPDAQPDASRASGAHAARRARSRREPARPSGRRHDEARRRRPLHARALLRVADLELPGRHRGAVAASPRDADGWSARSDVACDHPQELRLHALHRRARSRGARQGLDRQAVLRAVSGAGVAARARGRARHHDDAVPDDRLRRGARHVRP